MGKYIDTDKISLDTDGKVVLDDDELRELEKSFSPTAGAGTNTSCPDTTNDVCRNTMDCSNTTNQTACTNATPTVCEGSQPPTTGQGYGGPN